MKILGIQWGDTSSACLVKDGKVISATSEERYSRRKNDMQFPQKSLNFCKSSCDKVDKVVLSSVRSDYVSKLINLYSLPVSEIIKMQHYYYYPAFYENKKPDLIKLTKHLHIKKQYPENYWKIVDNRKIKTFTEDRTEIVSNFLKIKKEKISKIEHHLCHASYGYFTSNFFDKPCLVLTIDGAGDFGINATVCIAEKGKIKRIYETTNCIIGRIYSYVTLVLGMRRLEHEYKLMGLAPYGMKKDFKPTYEVFNEILNLEGYKFTFKNKPQDSYFHFKRKLEGQRFDVVAAGLQKWTEDIIFNWVSNAIKETKIKDVVISGGVSMNVKAMGNLMKIKNLKNLWVPGAGNDDSLCIGAALNFYHTNQKPKKHYFLRSLYLGEDSNYQEDEFINRLKRHSKKFIIHKYSPESAARLLSKGYVLGRCSGKMEFGARALGNRSILADPRDFQTIKKINEMIKNRDFWMPFAPSIMENYKKKYILNFDKSLSEHMTIVYETTKEGTEKLKAACHPSDNTVRAQIVFKHTSLDFFKLIEAFSKITGVGALLNTSFNLHGFPIVRNLTDALYVLKNSGLNGVITNKYIIMKRDKK